MKNKEQKQAVPILICAGAVLLIAGAGIFFLNHFSSTGKTMNLSEYYGVVDADEAALVVDDTVLDAKGIVRDGQIYVNYKTVWDYIDCGYYWDASAEQLQLTLPGETCVWTPDDGTGEVILDSDNSPWISADLISEYSDVDVQSLDSPSRVVIRTNWNSLTTCTVTKKSAIRYRGGRRSKILKEAEAGETLVLLDTVDDWSHVSSEDGYIGYIKSSDITVSETSVITHETDSRFVFPLNRSSDPVIMGWHYIDTVDNNQYLQDRIADAAGMNTITPTWFSIADQQGNLTSLASADYVAAAHAAGLKVWGMLGDAGGSGADTGTVLADSAARSNLITQLLQTAADTGLDGLNIDMETVTEETAPQFLQFLKELSISAHAQGLVLSVDNFVPTYTWYYRRAEQAKCVDYIIIMGYDEHTASSEEIGSAASIGFVEQGITDTLAEVDASAVINAVPFYGRCWVERFGDTVPDTQALGMADEAAFVSEHGITLEWDDSVGQNVGSSEDESARYSIWVEDAESVAQKVELVNSYNLAGVAAWRLGLEDAGIWSVIVDTMS